VVFGGGGGGTGVGVARLVWLGMGRGGLVFRGGVGGGCWWSMYGEAVVLALFVVLFLVFFFFHFLFLSEKPLARPLQRLQA